MRISIEWRYKKYGKTALTKGTNAEKNKCMDLMHK